MLDAIFCFRKAALFSALKHLRNRRSARLNHVR
jgi:hypothetical protein